jgi:membrane dipeptidase
MKYCSNLVLLVLVLLLSAGVMFAADEMERALYLHKKILTLDTHCDTPLHMLDGSWNIAAYHAPKTSGSGKMDLPRMAAGNLDAEFFAVFVSQRECTPENYVWARRQADTLLTIVTQMCLSHADTAALALLPDDAKENARRGRLSIYLGLENGFPIAADLTHVARYYDSGIRYITLCHTRNNQICDSSTDPAGPQFHGLSAFGETLVHEMNRLGMIIDMSHASDESFYDCLNLSDAPIMASHSCCRALCDNPRNLSDDMLKALAKKGGVMQMCILSDYVKKTPANPEREAAIKALEEKYGPWDSVRNDSLRRVYRKAYRAVDERYPRDKATVADVVDHIDHVVQLVGIDYIGIGTDFDGGGGVSGCDDVTEMPNITLELLRRGYSEKDIRKIWGENFLRVFRQVNKMAKVSRHSL